MDNYLSRLAEELESAPFLSKAVRDAISEWASQQETPENLIRYLENYLPELRRAAKLAETPRFLNLCNMLREVDAPSALVEVLGTPKALEWLEETGFELEIWERLRQLQGIPERRLYCYLSGFALAFRDVDPKVAELCFLEIDCVFASTSAQAEAMVKRFAKYFQLPDSVWDFSVWKEVHARIQKEGSLQELLLHVQLGKMLIVQGRTSEAASLLESLLGLEEDCPSDPTSISLELNESYNRWLAWFVLNSSDEDGLAGQDPETLSSVERNLAKIQFGYTIHLLAHSYFQEGQTSRSLQWLCAYFSLPPYSLPNLASLASRGRDLQEGQIFQNALSQWVNSLIREDSWHQVVSWLMVFFSDRKSQEIWHGSSANALAMLLTEIGIGLQDIQRSLTVIELFRTALNLKGRDLADREIGLSDLPFYHIQPWLVLPFVGVMAYALIDEGQTPAALNLIESALQLTPDRYESPEVLFDHLRRYWTGDIPLEREYRVLVLFAIHLRSQGRLQDASVVFNTIRPDVSTGSGQTYEVLKEQLADYDAITREQLIGQLAIGAVFHAPGYGFHLLADSFGFSPVEICNPEHVQPLVARYQQHYRHLTWLHANYLLISLLMIHEEDPEPLHAGRLIGEAALQLPSDWQAVPQQFPLYEGGEYYHLQLPLSNQLAAIYLELGEGETALALLQHIWQITADVWNSPGQVVIHLQQVLGLTGQILKDYSLNLFTRLIEVFSALNRKDDLLNLYRHQLQDLDWLSLEDQSTSPLLIGELAEVVITHIGPLVPGSALRIGSRYVEYFSMRILRKELSLQDRLFLLKFTASIRRRIIQFGYRDILANPADDQLRLELLRLDQELGERYLTERLAFQQLEPLEVEAVTFHEWPIQEAEAPLDSDSAAVPMGVARLRQREWSDTAHDGMVPILNHRPDSPEQHVPSVDQLAHALLDDDLLLCAGFSTEGQLVWTLFCRDESTKNLRVVAHDNGSGDPSQRTRLETAITAHDKAIECAWERHECTLPRSDHRPSLIEDLGDLFEAYRQDGDRLREEFQFLLPQLSKACPHLLQAMQSDSSFATLFPDSSARIPQSISESWNQFAEFWFLDHLGLEMELDQATDSFLREVADIWPLESLADHLNRDDHDLIVQFDDILHSVPPAFLRIGDAFLVEHVKTVRVVFSLLQGEYLREIEYETLHEQERMGNVKDRRVLSLSWFDPQDVSARFAAANLHRGLRDHLTANDQLSNLGYRWMGAMDLPSGSHQTLGAVLGDGLPCQVAAVCGHGVASSYSGVLLSDGLWTGSQVLSRDASRHQYPGQGCNLRNIEFLVQVACSVGRVSQTLEAGVDGFCVELTASQARSVLAGLWSLHCHHAVDYCNDVIFRFLRYREDSCSRFSRHLQIAGTGLRGKALADIQREAIENARRNHSEIIPHLNTLAALVLFGLA